jgi:hypothetical protein
MHRTLPDCEPKCRSTNVPGAFVEAKLEVIIARFYSIICTSPRTLNRNPLTF